MPLIFLLKQHTLTHVLPLVPNFYQSRHKIMAVFTRARDRVEQ